MLYLPNSLGIEEGVVIIMLEVSQKQSIYSGLQGYANPLASAWY